MESIIIIILFILGCLFSNASHIPAWFLGSEKPSHPHWKTYGLIAIIIWISLFIFVSFKL